MSRENFNLPIFNVLKDTTRLKIISCLAVYRQLTLKQLSEYIEKGKTTIHHHIKILESLALVVFIKRDDDYRDIKTRYYSLNPQNSYIRQLIDFQEEYNENKSIPEFDVIKTQAHLTTTWINWYVEYLEKKYSSDHQNYVKEFDTSILPFLSTIQDILETIPIRDMFDKGGK